MKHLSHRCLGTRGIIHLCKWFALGAIIASYGCSQSDLKNVQRPIGRYSAGSRIEDEAAPGGYAHSSNFPQLLTDSKLGTPGAISLVAITPEDDPDNKGEGVMLFLVNRTDKT